MVDRASEYRDKLLILRAPHIWQGTSVSKLMYLVVIALLFPTGAGIYFFGYYAALSVIVCVATAVITEWLIKKWRKRPFVMDGSAVITGLLLALVLPPTLPLWMAALGTIFSIAVAKEAFGGLGCNIFNPALAGRAFLTVCFAGEMTTWVAPTGFTFDAVSTATPLNSSFVFTGDKVDLYWNLLIGNVGGSIGETSALFVIIGGLILLVTRAIDWRIPLFYVGTVALGSAILGQDVIFHLLAGGLLLGALFMATDYVTSPVTGRGRIIFGIGAGVLVVLIRNFGGMPEGVCFSILLMNCVTPLIDKHIRPRPFGYQKVKAAKM